MSTGEGFLKRLIGTIRNQIRPLGRAVFFVYIDEYENLAEYQQRLVNTWLKHSEPPLIFNLAMKRNGFGTRATIGAETLSAKHDFCYFDLEDYDLDRQFSPKPVPPILLRAVVSSRSFLPGSSPRSPRPPRCPSVPISVDQCSPFSVV
jgi:hypothetical protein